MSLSTHSTADHTKVKGKAPQFFIPASYKGNQARPALAGKVSSANLTIGPQPRASTTAAAATVGANGKQLSEDRAIDTNANVKPAIVNGSQTTDHTQSSLLLPSPGGVLDLSLYNYTPAQDREFTKSTGRPHNGELRGKQSENEIDVQIVNGTTATSAAETTAEVKEKKKRRFRRPRRNSKIDRVIQFLEDKRVKDDEGEELEDLQMPLLRKVLNIIFVTLGVSFLVAVIIVIMYTSLAR